MTYIKKNCKVPKEAQNITYKEKKSHYIELNSD